MPPRVENCHNTGVVMINFSILIFHVLRWATSENHRAAAERQAPIDGKQAIYNSGRFGLESDSTVKLWIEAIVLALPSTADIIAKAIDTKTRLERFL